MLISQFLNAKISLHFNLAISQCSTSIYLAFDGQTEFSRVFNFAILSFSQYLWKFEAQEKYALQQGCARGLFSRDRDLEAKTEAESEALTSSQGETKTKAFRARDRDEDEAYQLRGETEPRHYCASRRPWDRGVKTEATSHIHIIPRTLKRSGEA